LLKSALFTWLFVVVAMFNVGCGITGRTGVVKPNIEVPPPDGVAAIIRVDSITVERKATTLQNVGTYAWGTFDQNDLANLEESLVRMVDKINDARPVGEKEQTLYLILRSYQIATDNKSATVLACVAWAVTDHEQAILYHEQFYASSRASWIGTIGGVKNAAHEALLTRIGKSIALLSGGKIDELPVSVDGTHITIDDLKDDLPEDMHSILVDRDDSFYSVSEDAKWDFKQHSTRIDWLTYIQSRKVKSHRIQ
jgi:hypothetical protein